MRRRRIVSDYSAFPNVPARNGLQATVEIPLLVRALGLSTRGSILEVGCGRGVALPALFRLLDPAYLAGLDVDRSLLAVAAEHVRGEGIDADLVHGDVRALPFSDGHFDLLVDFGTCYHIARPLDALREIARVLRPGGRFVHETRVSQHLAHPVRSFRCHLPWASAGSFTRERTAVLWSRQQKTVGAG
ncbi:MAG: class I SAM-dependent methyltransferase [Gemmatimonadaceae bacterium]